jgi:hypothetical protein
MGTVRGRVWDRLRKGKVGAERHGTRWLTGKHPASYRLESENTNDPEKAAPGSGGLRGQSKGGAGLEGGRRGRACLGPSEKGTVRHSQELRVELWQPRWLDLCSFS